MSSFHKNLHICVDRKWFWTSSGGETSSIFLLKIHLFQRGIFDGTCWPSVVQRKRQRQLCFALVKAEKIKS